MDTLNDGGTVVLWGGWSIRLPPACHDRNQDGSWSAWGADWTVDVTIIETAGDSSGAPIRPELFLGKGKSDEEISGSGWVGERGLLREDDNGRAVLRLTATLCAPYSIMHCYVSFFDEERLEFAYSLVAGIAHSEHDRGGRSRHLDTS